PASPGTNGGAPPLDDASTAVERPLATTNVLPQIDGYLDGFSPSWQPPTNERLLGAAMGHTTVDDGARLWWEAGGEGDPLLLIQGLGFSGAMWLRLLPALEARHRVIRYDARGIGRSDVPPG